MLGDVELVEADLLLCIVQVPFDDRDVRRPHVHGDGFNVEELARLKEVEEALEALLLAVIGHVQNVTSGRVCDDRHVLVPLLERRFIHSDSSWREVLSALQAATNSALHDPVDLVPGETKPPRNGGGIGLLQPADCEGLEGGGEPRTRVSPGDQDLLHSVFRTTNPGDLGHDHRPVLASIQMAPTTLASVVNSALNATFRASHPRSPLCLQVDLDLLTGWVQLDARDAPRLRQAQHLRVQVTILHAREDTLSPPLRAFFYRDPFKRQSEPVPTRNPEAPP